MVKVHHALLELLLFLLIFGFGSSISLQEGLLTHLGHLLLEVEEVLLLQSLLNLIFTHILILHVGNHLLAFDQLFIAKPKVITFVFILAAEGLLSSFHSLPLALGEVIFIFKVNLTASAFPVVAHDHRIEYFKLLGTLISHYICHKFLPHGFISRANVIVIVSVDNEVFQICILALLVLLVVVTIDTLAAVIIVLVIRAKLGLIFKEPLSLLSLQLSLALSFFDLLGHLFLDVQNVKSIGFRSSLGCLDCLDCFLLRDFLRLFS